MRKTVLILLLIFASRTGFSQVLDSIYFNLYTDSLKKGTYNYINVEGLYSNKKVLPLDTTQLSFSSSFGKFHRNSLWIPFEATVDRVNITVTLRSNPANIIRRTLYVKKKED